MGGLLSIKEAAVRGISRLRQPQWANPMDHIELHIGTEGRIGPWIKLWSPTNVPVLKQADPQHLLSFQFDENEKAYVPFIGEYSAAFEPRFDVEDAGDGMLIVTERKRVSASRGEGE